MIADDEEAVHALEWRFFSVVAVLLIVTSSISIWMGFARNVGFEGGCRRHVMPAPRLFSRRKEYAAYRDSHRQPDVRRALLLLESRISCSTSHRRARLASAFVGVDFSRLAFRSTVKGVKSGTAYLAGVLRDGTLHVTKQGPPRYANDSPGPWRRPPCATPTGGWIDSTVNPPTDAIDQYSSRHRWDLTADALPADRR